MTVLSSHFLAAVSVERIGWTLIHSVWQFVLLGLFLVIVERLLSKRSASAKYLLASAVLCLMIGTTVVTFLTTAGGESVSVSSQTDSTARDARPLEPQIGGYALDRGRLHAVYVDGQYTRPHEWDLLPHASQTDDQEDPADASSLITQSESPGRTPESHAETDLAFIGSIVRPWLPTCVSAWLIGMSAAALRLITGGLHVRRLRRQGRAPVSEDVQRLLSVTGERIGVRRAVEIAQSSLVAGPVVIGWLKPLILLPATSLTGLSTDQLEAVLAHELAHIRRFDYLVNLLQTIVETIFFYHPAVWWVSRRMRIHREDCCDDRAVAVVATPLAYASALLKLCELQDGRPAQASAVALSATGGSLKKRIHRVLGITEPLQSAPSWRLAGGVFGLVLVIAGCGLLADDAQVRQQGEARERERIAEARELQRIAEAAAGLESPAPDPETGLYPPARTPEEREHVLLELEKLGLSRSRELGLDRSRAPGAKAFTANLFKTPEEAMPLVGRLDSIRILSLNGCGESVDAFRHVAGLRNLERLSVLNSQFTAQHLETLAPLQRLRELEVVMMVDYGVDRDRAEQQGKLTPEEEQRFDAIVRSDRDKGHLKSLAGTAILTDRALAALVNLKALTKVRLLHGPVSNFGLEVLSTFPLEHLEVTVAGPISAEGVHSLAALPRLETLYLLGTMDAAAADPFSQAQALKRLKLRSIDDGVAKSIAGMPALEWLHLWHNSLSDDGLMHLAAIETLQYIDLRSPASTGTLTVEGIERFQAARPDCKVLHKFRLESLTERHIAVLDDHFLLRLHWHKATSRQHLVEEMQKRYGDSERWVEFRPLTSEGYLGGIALVRSQAGLDWLKTELESHKDFDVAYAEALNAWRLKNEGVMFNALLQAARNAAGTVATKSPAVTEPERPRDHDPVPSNDPLPPLEDVIASLRANGSDRSADYLEGRFEYLKGNLGEDREVLVYGQVIAPPGESPGYCDGQMLILDEGWFVDIIGDKDRAVAFRMFGCRPVDVTPSRVNPDVQAGETMSLGRIVMEPFPPEELGVVRGRMKFEGEPPNGILARVIIKSGRANSDTGGTNGFRPWPEKENLTISDDLQFEHRHLAPVPHRLSIEMPGYRTITRDIEPGAGATLDLGTIEVPKAIRVHAEFLTSETPDFTNATRRETTVELRQVWRSNPGNRKLAAYPGGDMRFMLRPPYRAPVGTEERLHLHSGVASLKIADLGPGEFAEFEREIEPVPKLLPHRQVPIESGHVYLTYHTHWKHWTLLRVVVEE